MRRKKSLLIAVLSLFVVVAFSSFLFADAFHSNPELNQFKGTVSFRYGGGYFLETDNGKEYKLVVGPPWYLERLGLSLSNGDSVEVIGAVDEDGDELFVSTIKKDGKAFKISDSFNYSFNNGSFECHGPFRGSMKRGMMGGRGFNSDRNYNKRNSDERSGNYWRGNRTDR